MSKFNDLFQHIISEMNITNLTNEAICKPDTMLNQSILDSKKIPNERKAKVIVKKDGNTTGIEYTVDSDTSAEYMVDNIKANGGEASIQVSSGITKECSKKEVSEEDTENQELPIEEPINSTKQELTDGQQFAQDFEAEHPFDQEKYNQYLEEGKQLGIDAVTQYLQEHSNEVSQDFSFNEAPEEEYFVEYALVKYNTEN